MRSPTGSKAPRLPTPRFPTTGASTKSTRKTAYPYIDKLVGLFIKEEATYLAGLRAGKIDYLGFTGGVSDIVRVDQVDNLRRTEQGWHKPVIPQ